MTTEKQAAILDFIRAYEDREHVPASTRRIAASLHRCQSTVMRHLKALAGAGLIVRRSDGRWGSAGPAKRCPLIPVYGSIPAGAPAFREQTPESELPLDPRLLGIRGEAWAVRVHGDSMIGDHIAAGDIAVLEKRDARPGEIIAALVDGIDVTLKRYLTDNGRAVLRSSNPHYEDRFPEKLECQGVLVAVFRKIA